MNGPDDDEDDGDMMDSDEVRMRVDSSRQATMIPANAL